MLVDSIIEYLNGYIQLLKGNKAGCLVLHKEVSRHPVVKIYHNYHYKIWLITKEGQKLLTTFCKSFNASEYTEAQINKEMEKAFCIHIFWWLRSKEFKEQFDEQVSD